MYKTVVFSKESTLYEYMELKYIPRIGEKLRIWSKDIDTINMRYSKYDYTVIGITYDTDGHIIEIEVKS